MDSFAYSIAPPEHWDIVDCIALVSQEEKIISSSHGHTLASTSLYQPMRVSDAPRRLKFAGTPSIGVTLTPWQRWSSWTAT
jgi:diphosphomevalonate decarboxylase